MYLVPGRARVVGDDRRVGRGGIHDRHDTPDPRPGTRPAGAQPADRATGYTPTGTLSRFLAGRSAGSFPGSAPCSAPMTTTGQDARRRQARMTGPADRGSPET